MKKKELLEKISILENIIKDDQEKQREKVSELLAVEIEAFETKTRKLGAFNFDVETTMYRASCNTAFRKYVTIKFEIME
jgi:hypothetical protein